MSFPKIRIGIEPREPKPGEIMDCTAMRRAIHEASHESALVRNVMMAADHNGMTAEDRYTYLAYQSLVALETYYKRCLEFTMKSPYVPEILK